MGVYDVTFNSYTFDRNLTDRQTFYYRFAARFNSSRLKLKDGCVNFRMSHENRFKYLRQF